MSENMEKERKRVFFSHSDAQLLIDCAKPHANVLNNIKTNGITLEKKKKVNFIQKCM